MATLKNHPDAPDPPLTSLRDAISRQLPEHFEIFRPEEIQDWHSDAVFSDLISFERALASICSLLVIILESPGSLVELGAFSQLPELSEKSVVILSSEYSDDKSFINFGIIRFLAKKNASRVKTYPWIVKSPTSIDAEIVSDAIADIQLELDKCPASSQFNVERDAHCMVMISELLRLFIALKEQEIAKYLEYCGFSTTPEQLRGNLFLLKSLKFVRTLKYSDATFYLSGSESFHRLRFAAKDRTKQIDTLRIGAQCLEFYKSESKHKNRHRAIGLSKTGASR